MTETQPESVGLAGELGADGGTSVQCFSIYIPDKDQQGNEIGNQRKWVLEALDLYSYVVPDVFLADLPRIRQFLHRMGRETNQGEVAFEFDGQFYRIRQYDDLE